MRAAVFHGPGDVRVEEVVDPRPFGPTDAVVRVTHAAICGTDLWTYTGRRAQPPGSRVGHEFLGVVDWAGPEVTTVRRGDRVLAPFVWSDGTCRHCRAGYPTSCPQGGRWGIPGSDGGLGEAVRVPWADATLVRVGADLDADPDLAAAVLLLTDVVGTGHHAAVMAGVGPGATVAVVGDGAVGLSAVLAAVRLGAERVIAVGHHQPRLRVAEHFGATGTAASSEEAAARLHDLTDGLGADAVLECVGTESSLDVALDAVRDGGVIGLVGSPDPAHAVRLRRLYSRNVGLRAGIAPVRRYLPDLLAAVLGGRFDPSPLFDHTVPLADVTAGFAAMASREAIKTLVRVD